MPSLPSAPLPPQRPAHPFALRPSQPSCRCRHCVCAASRQRQMAAHAGAQTLLGRRSRLAHEVKPPRCCAPQALNRVQGKGLRQRCPAGAAAAARAAARWRAWACLQTLLKPLAGSQGSRVTVAALPESPGTPAALAARRRAPTLAQRCCRWTQHLSLLPPSWPRPRQPALREPEVDPLLGRPPRSDALQHRPRLQGRPCAQECND